VSAQTQRVHSHAVVLLVTKEMASLAQISTNV